MKREYRLNELFDLQMGKTPARKNPEYWNSEDHKWVSIADLSNCGKYIVDTKEYISDRAVEESGISLIPKNTVIMSFKLSIGKTAITSEPMYSNEAIMSFRDKHVIELLPDYLYYMFSGQDWEAGTNKAVMGKTLNKATLSSRCVKVHGIEKQREIVTVLDKVKAVLDSREEELEKLDELIKARFVEMFGDQGDNPLGFEVGTLKDVADIYLGLTHTPTYVESGKPFLSVRDISSGTIDFSNCHYITEEEFQSLPKGARPMTNDLLFCRVGTIGKPVIVPEGIPEFGSFVSVGYLRKKENVLNEYLKSWMEDPFFMKQVYDNVSGASQINLNTGWLKNFSILVPPLDLQKQFAAFVEQVDKSKVD